MTEKEYCNVYALAKINSALDNLRKCWPECEHLIDEAKYKDILKTLAVAQKKGWELVSSDEEE